MGFTFASLLSIIVPQELAGSNGKQKLIKKEKVEGAARVSGLQQLSHVV